MRWEQEEEGNTAQYILAVCRRWHKGCGQCLGKDGEGLSARLAFISWCSSLLYTYGNVLRNKSLSLFWGCCCHY